MDMVNRITNPLCKYEDLGQEKMCLIKNLDDLEEQKSRAAELSFESDHENQDIMINEPNDLEVQNRVEKELMKTKDRMAHAKKWSRDRRRELFNKNLILTEKLETAERELKIIRESKKKSYTARMILMNENADLNKRIQVLETQLKDLQIKKEELRKENSNMIESFCKTHEELRNENIDLVNKVNRLHKISKDASPEIRRLTDMLACCKEDNENYKASQEKLILELQSVKAQLSDKLSGLTIEKVSEIHFTRELATQKDAVVKELVVVKNNITSQSVPEDAGDSEGRR